VSAEQRDCPQCGTPFTWTPAAPRQKYCSARCKHRWHRAHGKPRRRRARKTATRDVARQPGTTTEVAAPLPPQAGAEPGLAAGPACPHCRKPVALVAWLVPPAAATVKEPPRHADTVRDNP
jgi:endogenous inhibitor of DNA gyrase (YacG/DUF329 family)